MKALFSFLFLNIQYIFLYLIINYGILNIYGIFKNMYPDNEIIALMSVTSVSTLFYPRMLMNTKKGGRKLKSD